MTEDFAAAMLGAGASKELSAAQDLLTANRGIAAVQPHQEFDGNDCGSAPATVVVRGG